MPIAEDVVTAELPMRLPATSNAMFCDEVARRFLAFSEARRLRLI